MESTLEAVMAAFFDAAMIAMIFHLIHEPAGGPVSEKILCGVMAFGFLFGMAASDAGHAYAALALCALGVLLSYVAEGFACAELPPEGIVHE